MLGLTPTQLRELLDTGKVEVAVLMEPQPQIEVLEAKEVGPPINKPGDWILITGYNDCGPLCAVRRVSVPDGDDLLYSHWPAPHRVGDRIPIEYGLKGFSGFNVSTVATVTAVEAKKMWRQTEGTTTSYAYVPPKELPSGKELWHWLTTYETTPNRSE